MNLNEKGISINDIIQGDHFRVSRKSLDRSRVTVDRSRNLFGPRKCIYCILLQVTRGL
jgi:hypothetical protein